VTRETFIVTYCRMDLVPALFGNAIAQDYKCIRTMSYARLMQTEGSLKTVLGHTKCHELGPYIKLCYGPDSIGSSI